jgi:hypothetical protein
MILMSTPLLYPPGTIESGFSNSFLGSQEDKLNYFEFDTNVSKKTRAMQQSAREFGMEVMRPAGIELDKREYRLL